ncbi:MAG: arylsulfatase, partial [Verrucomicrobia bacterium]|nr:arylsulfatase [Verrucomicrobiota bacterium]
LPTIAALVNSPLPADRKIDGLDVSGLLTGDAAKSPRHEFIHYTSQGALEGIRQGRWKLLVKQPSGGSGVNPSTPAPEVLLFDLMADIGEKASLAQANPEIVKSLQARMIELDAEIEANTRAPWTKSSPKNTNR